MLGSIYNSPIQDKVLTAEVQTVVYHSSYLPFVDPNVDDNSRDIAVLALTTPLQFTGETRLPLETRQNSPGLASGYRLLDVIATEKIDLCSHRYAEI